MTLWRYCIKRAEAKPNSNKWDQEGSAKKLYWHDNLCSRLSCLQLLSPC